MTARTEACTAAGAERQSAAAADGAAGEGQNGMPWEAQND
jgi:hypothetical protein